MKEAENATSPQSPFAWLRGNAERIAAAAMALFGIFWMVAAHRQQYFVDTPHISLSFMPFAAGAILTAFSIYLVFWPSRDPYEIDADSGLEAEMGLEEGGAEAGEVYPPAKPGAGALKVALAFVALAVYALVLTRVHSLITTFGLVAVGLALCGEPIRLRLFVIAAIIAAILYAIFMLWLGVPLPGGRYT